MSTIVLNKNNLFLPLMKKDAKLKAILDSGSEDIAIKKKRFFNRKSITFKVSVLGSN